MVPLLRADPPVAGAAVADDRWSTVFFIFVPGRMVPAMAIVTSAVQPRLRGTFLSMNGAVDRVGYLAMGATLAAMAFVGQIDMHTGKPPNVRPG
jgi:hypothetical protein